MQTLNLNPQLGFGLLRLPKLADVPLAGGTFDNNAAVGLDMPELERMVDAFLEAGGGYFATASGYAGSEAAIRKALVERHDRSEYFFADQLTIWEEPRPRTQEEAWAIFDTSLERSGLDYFDAYLVHNYTNTRVEMFDRFDIWGLLAQKKAAGLIRQIGFSTHGQASFIDQVLNEHPEVDFIQLQLNYADWDDSSYNARACYQVAREHGVPIVCMEPVKGGVLTELPDEAAALLRAARPEASLASWALRFVGSLEGVSTVLSGMSSLEQMRDNIATFASFEPLTLEDRKALDQVRGILARTRRIPCTGCRYCHSGCPAHIAIPEVLAALNKYDAYGDLARGRSYYLFETQFCGRASDCTQCGACEEACPQNIPIREHLKRAAELFDI
jgi:predicted aldo/keto reductase-like oxidoreductase